MVANKQSLYSGLYQVVMVASGVLFLSISTRYLSPADYGKWTLFQSYVAVISLATLPGSVKASLRGFVKGFPGNYRYLVGRGARLSVVGVGGSLLLAWAFRTDTYLCLSFGLLAITLIPYVLFQQYTVYYTGQQNFRGLLFTIIIQRGGLLILCFVPLMFHRSLPWFTFTNIAVIGAANTLFTFIAFRHIPLNAEREHDVLRYALAITVMNAFAVVAGSAQKIVLDRSFGLATLGQFGVANTLVAVTESGISSLILPYALRIAGTTASQHARYVFHRTAKLFLLGCGLYLVVLVVGIVAIPRLVSSSYGEVALYFGLLAVPIAVVPLNTVYLQMLTIQKFIKLQVIHGVFVSLVRLIGYFFLIPRLSVFGIAIANSSSVVLGLVIVIMAMFMFSRNAQD